MSEIVIKPNGEAPTSAEYSSRASAIAATTMDMEHLGKAMKDFNKALESGSIKVPTLNNPLSERFDKPLSNANILDVLNTYTGGQKADIQLTLGEGEKAQKLTVPVTHDNIEKMANALELAASKALEIKDHISPDKTVTMKDVQMPVFDVIQTKLAEFKSR